MSNATLDLIVNLTGAGAKQMHDLEGETDNLAKTFKGAKDDGGGFFGVIKGGIGSVVGMANPVGLAIGGITALGGALIGATKAAADEAVGVERMNTALQNNIPGWSGNTDAVESYISSQEKLSFADDQLRDSLGFLVGQTHDLAAAQNLQALAMDLSRAKNISLEAATKLVGKVDMDNIGTLKKLGIEMDKNATSEEALAAVRAQTAGQAEAYAGTAAGAMDRLQTMIGDTVENIGGVLLPIVTTGLQTLTNGAQVVADVIGQAATAVGAFIQPTIDFIGQLIPPMGEATDATTTLGSTVTDVFTAIQAVVQPVLDVVFGELARFWTEIQPDVVAAAQNMQVVITNVFTAVQGVIQGALQFIQGAVATFRSAWESNWGGIRTIVEGVWNVIKATITTVWNIIQGIITTGLAVLKGDWSGAWEGVKGILSAAWEGMKGILAAALPTIITIITQFIPTLAGKITEMAGYFINWVATDVLPKLPGVLGNIWSGITSWIAGVIPQIANAVGTIGAGIIDGIKNGISRAWDGLVAFLSSKVKDALPQFLKDWLGIASPSTVTTEMGDYLAQGLGEGFKQGEAAMLDDFRSVLNMMIAEVMLFFDKDSDDSIRGMWDKGLNGMYAHLAEAWGPQTDIQWKTWLTKWKGYIDDFYRYVTERMPDPNAYMPPGGTTTGGGGGGSGSGGGGGGGGNTGHADSFTGTDWGAIAGSKGGGGRGGHTFNINVYAGAGANGADIADRTAKAVSQAMGLRERRRNAAEA